MLYPLLVVGCKVRFIWGGTTSRDNGGHMPPLKRFSVFKAWVLLHARSRSGNTLL